MKIIAIEDGAIGSINQLASRERLKSAPAKDSNGIVSGKFRQNSLYSTKKYFAEIMKGDFSSFQSIQKL